MSDTTRTECGKCNRPYQLRQDSEPTDYCDECAHSIVSQLETELTTARAEIERLRGEIEKAWEEGFKSGPDFWKANSRWHGSRAKRVMEGKE